RRRGMNCRRTEQQLSDHLEGLLSQREARALTTHLDQCARCRRLRAEMAAAGAGVRELATPIPSRDLRQVAIERWIGEQTAMAARPDCHLPGRLIRAASLCLAAGMLMALLVFAGPPRGNPRLTIPLPRVARNFDFLPRKRESSENAK